MKAEGSDPKAASRRLVEVPTDKPGLMEFLTFHNVNVVNPGARPGPEVATGGAPAPQPPASPVAAPDVDALRAEYNPEAVPTTVSFPSERIDLDALFLAAPLGQQLTLAGLACENAYKQIG